MLKYLIIPDDVGCKEDPDKWFSDDWWDIQETIKVCNRCPIRVQCLEAGFDQEYGVFGGLSALQRARLRGKRDAQTDRAKVS